MRNPKQSLLLFFTIALFFSCKKDKGEPILEIHSLSEDSLEIFFDYSAYHSNPKVTVSSVGLYIGTDWDLQQNGQILTHAQEGVQLYHGSIAGLEKNTTYYLQPFAKIDEIEHLGETQTITTSGNWEPLTTAPSGDFRTVAISPGGIVHIAGLDGVHYYSSDEGFNWTQVTHTNNYDLSEMAFMNENVVYVQAFNTIRKSTNGGLSWITLNTPPPQIKSVFFYDEDNLYISNGDTVYASHDGGSNWNGAFTPCVNQDGLSWDMHFITADIGYSVSWTGDVRKTTDGGLSWDLLTFPTISNGVCDEMWFINEYEGIVATRYGVLRTVDGGVNWTEVRDITSSQFFEITFLNDEFGFLVGEDSYFLLTYDGGKTWESAYYDYENFADTWDVEIYDNLKGYALRDDGIVLKYD